MNYQDSRHFQHLGASGHSEDRFPGVMVITMSLSLILVMSATAAFPTLLPELSQAWALSGRQSGLIHAAFYVGYILAVPLLVGATDRIDARWVFIMGASGTALGTLSYFAFVHDVLTAVICQVLCGAGLGGTYMPGLKALIDRSGERWEGRAIAVYTACYAFGLSLSFTLFGYAPKWFGWQSTFLVACVMALSGAGIVYLALPPVAVSAKHRQSLLRSLTVVLKDRAIRPFVFAYMGHTWELLGFLSWCVAFWTFSQSISTGPHWVSVAGLAAVVPLLGFAASMAGNEIAARAGYRKWIRWVMGISFSISVLLAWNVDAPFPWMIGLTFLYALLIHADSAAITAAVVSVTRKSQRGSVLAVYSSVGFLGGVLGPMVAGSVFDMAGGGATGWSVLFIVLGAGSLFGGIALRGTVEAESVSKS